MTSRVFQAPRTPPSAAAKPRVVLMPFDRPDHLPAWTAGDASELESALVAALRQRGTVAAATAPRGTEPPLERAAIAKAGRALGADYLLEGGVTEYGSEIEGPPGVAPSVLQITFQLFDGRTGALVWVDEANASSAASSLAARVRELSQAVAHRVAARVAETEFPKPR